MYADDRVLEVEVSHFDFAINVFIPIHFLGLSCVPSCLAFVFVSRWACTPLPGLSRVLSCPPLLLSPFALGPVVFVYPLSEFQGVYLISIRQCGARFYGKRQMVISSVKLTGDCKRLAHWGTQAYPVSCRAWLWSPFTIVHGLLCPADNLELHLFQTNTMLCNSS
ncbi:uncharacterized protein LOC144797974 [Lissotriton helveticus]